MRNPHGGAVTYIGGSRFGGSDGSAFSWLGIAFSSVVGLLAGTLIGVITEFFTGTDTPPVRRIVNACGTGSATTIISGLGVGMMSTLPPILIIGAAIAGSYALSGLYGIGIAGLGMLLTLGIQLSVDAYGPIADNAGGLAVMAELPPETRDITDSLDAVGNTTAAIGKGFAIGSAAYAAIGLLSAFMLAAKIEPSNMMIDNPKILAGVLIGAMMPFWFSSMLFRAVGKCADRMILEVRRQFREIPGLKEGKEGVHPDSVTCVDIATRGAINGMLLPGAMAILFPVIIGFSLQAEGLAGMLVGAIATGVMLGIQTANSGGAMDNAKKYIEEGNFGGKNSEAHKAAVVGDTVGDPLKDTVGPSINILIKLMCVISLVLAPLF